MIWKFNMLSSLKMFSKAEFKYLKEEIYEKFDEVSASSLVKKLENSIGELLEYYSIFRGANLKNSRDINIPQLGIKCTSTMNSITIEISVVTKKFLEKNVPDYFFIEGQEIAENYDFINLIKCIMGSRLLDDNFIPLHSYSLAKDKYVKIKEKVDEVEDIKFFSVAFIFKDSDHFKMTMEFDNVQSSLAGFFDKNKEELLEKIGNSDSDSSSLDYFSPPPYLSMESTKGSILNWKY